MTIYNEAFTERDDLHARQDAAFLDETTREVDDQGEFDDACDRLLAANMIHNPERRLAFDAACKRLRVAYGEEMK